MPRYPVGSKAGKLTILERGNQKLLCKCECGITKELWISGINRGDTKSCGCTRYTASGTPNKTHGMYGSPEYNSWQAMKQRCLNPKHKHYKSYGGRGIKICDRWMSFSNFFEDMGLKPHPKYCIDRKDNNGNYELLNCRWTTHYNNQQNKRCTTAKLRFIKK